MKKKLDDLNLDFICFCSSICLFVILAFPYIIYLILHPNNNNNCQIHIISNNTKYLPIVWHINNNNSKPQIIYPSSFFNVIKFDNITAQIFYLSCAGKNNYFINDTTITTNLKSFSCPSNLLVSEECFLPHKVSIVKKKNFKFKIGFRLSKTKFFHLYTVRINQTNFGVIEERHDINALSQNVDNNDINDVACKAPISIYGRNFSLTLADYENLLRQRIIDIYGISNYTSYVPSFLASPLEFILASEKYAVSAYISNVISRIDSREWMDIEIKIRSLFHDCGDNLPLKIINIPSREHIFFLDSVSKKIPVPKHLTKKVICRTKFHYEWTVSNQILTL